MVRLGDLFDFKNGRSFKKTEWKEAGLPIIRIQNLNKVSADFNFFDGEYDPAIEVNKSDLLFSWSGTVGSSFGPHIWERDRGVLNQHIFKISFKTDMLLKYAFYSLLFITEEIERSVVGAVGLVHVTKKSLNEFKIPAPPIPEQKRIVAILDQAFADIEQARAKTEQNLKNARELFENYLQQVCTKNERDWIKHEVGDVCDLWQGIAINKNTKHLLVEKSSLPLLRIKDLKNNTVEKYIKEDGFPKNSLINEGDVIYTRTGQIGLVFRGFKGVLHNNSFKVSPNEKIDKSYLFWWLQHSNFKNTVIQLSSRAAQPDITHALFKKQPITIPPIAYQLSSVILIEKINSLTQHVESLYSKKLSELDELKKSILQKAFNGELTKDKKGAAA